MMRWVDLPCGYYANMGSGDVSSLSWDHAVYSAGRLAGIGDVFGVIPVGNQ